MNDATRNRAKEAYLVDHVGIRTFDFDRMRGEFGVQGASPEEATAKELGVQLPFREHSAEWLEKYEVSCMVPYLSVGERFNTGGLSAVSVTYQE